MVKFNSETIKTQFFGHKVFLCLVFLFLAATTASSQKDNTKTIFEHFTSTEANAVHLSTDLTKLNGSRKSDDYQPAILTDTEGKKWKVEIKSRGKYRRKNGFIPPIKIKFPKKELAAAGLAAHNEIKVTMPFYEGTQGDDLIVREYLTYRMFEQLTPASMRGRLVKLTLTDSHVESWKHEAYTIFLEDDDELCARLDAEDVEIFGADPDSLQHNQAALVSAFNYMIGNSDWELAGFRNIKLLRAHAGGKLVVIPYDFDFSGVVNAPYSKPASMSGLKTTKQRFLMADGIKAEALRRAYAHMEKERPALRKIMASKYLRSSSEREILDYLATFFDSLKLEAAGGGAAVQAPMID